MTLSVDNALEFEPLAAHPNPPQDGGFLLYVFASDGQLYGLNESVPGPGGSSTGGVPGKVWGDSFRPPLLFFDTVATSTQAPTAADLNISNFVIGDVIVREADFEMFEYEQTGQFTQAVVDLGVKWGGVAGLPAGGTTGQVLAKRSNTDFDTQWVAQASGGAAPSVSNVASMNTAVRAYRNAALNVAANTWAQIAPDTKTLDPGNHFSTANAVYTAPSNGFYQVNGSAEVLASSVGTYTDCILAVYKNGTPTTGVALFQSNQQPAIENVWSVSISDVVQLNAGDTIGLWIFNGQAQALAISAASNYFSVVQVDKALAPTSGAFSAGTTARAYRAAAFNLVANAFTRVPLDSVSHDPGGHFNLTNGRYVAPVTGYYQINAMCSVNSSAVNQQIQATIQKNGVTVAFGTSLPNPVSGSTMNSEAADVVYLQAGDYIELYCFSTAAVAWNTGPLYGYLSVAQVDQPISNVVQPTTAARAYRNAAFNMPAGAWTKIPVDTVGTDPGGHVSLPNSRYVCPVTGYYAVSISVAYTPTAAALVAAACYKNGTAAFKSLISEPTPTAGVAGASASDIVFCNAGDYLELYGLSSVAAGLSIENTVNFISVVQVDQPIGGAGGNAVTPTTGARMYRNGAFTPTANTWVKVPLDTVSHDSGGHTDIANSRYICPNPGWYQVNANIGLNIGGVNATTTAYVGIAQNGTRVSTGGAHGSDEFNEVVCETSDLLWCAGGDVLELNVFSQTGSPLLIAASSNYLSVVQVDAPTPVASNTGARARANAAPAVGAGATLKIPIVGGGIAGTFDPGGHIDGTNNRYLVTAAGTYQVNGEIHGNSSSAVNIIAAIYKNGIEVSRGEWMLAGGATSQAAVVADLVQCNPGDYLELWINNQGTGSFSLTAPALHINYLSVVKVDQPQYANNPSVVTALPATPYDGQEIYFVADAANGVKWHLRYNAGSSSTHKWEFLGGAAIWAEVITQESTSAQSYANLTTVGPSLTIPLAGDYSVHFGANIEAAQASGWRGRVSPDATDAHCASAAGGGSASISFGAAVAREVTLTNLAATSGLSLAYRSDSGISVNFFDRWIRIRPVRVG